MEICYMPTENKLTWKFIMYTFKGRSLVSSVALISCFFSPFTVISIFWFLLKPVLCIFSSCISLWQLLAYINERHSLKFFVDIYRICFKICVLHLLIILQTYKTLLFIIFISIFTELEQYFLKTCLKDWRCILELHQPWILLEQGWV